MKEKLFNEINTMKMLVLSVGFVLMCAFLIFVFILPALSNYKIEKLRLNSQNSINHTIEQKLAQSEQILVNLQTENKKIFAQFDKKFDINTMRKFLEQFFDNVRINELERTKNEPKEEYLAKELHIKALMKSPEQFYTFMEATKDYENILAVQTPLKLQSQGQNIDFEFDMKIYSSMP